MTYFLNYTDSSIIYIVTETINQRRLNPLIIQYFYLISLAPGSTVSVTFGSLPKTL